MRPFIGLLLFLVIAGCTDSGNQSSKKYLFRTDRCADTAPIDSAEYKECRKKEAEEDAQRIYDMRRSVDSVPSYLPPTSLP